MLEAMAMGKPVVTHLWLDSCARASCFIDEKNLLTETHKEGKRDWIQHASFISFNSARHL